MKQPLVYTFIDGAMVPLGRFGRLAHEQYEPNQTYFLGDIEERSEVSHRHEFVWLKEAWETLPEDLGEKYPSSEHLRKAALIATGWSTIHDYACVTPAEARRTYAIIRSLVDEYAVVVVQDAVVRVVEARSQARAKMKPADFQKSKQDILDWVSGLLGVEPSSLSPPPETRGEEKMVGAG